MRFETKGETEQARNYHTYQLQPPRKKINTEVQYIGRAKSFDFIERRISASART